MGKTFNITANCIPGRHYMVDLTSRLEQIAAMVDRGDYFTINRGRQYGKTTTLMALEDYLKDRYLVISLDFQRISEASFATEAKFVAAFSRDVLLAVADIPNSARERFELFADKRKPDVDMDELFDAIIGWCAQSEKPIVLMIDEVDAASNYQVFLSFLAQLRGNYIRRGKVATFQSVILAGVYDIKNLKRKFVAPGEHQTNSPWNVAVKFTVDMSFSATEIAKMLDEYEADHETGMDTASIAGMIYDYTSGYPVLVSSICKLIDEDFAGSEDFPDAHLAWSERGVLAAVNHLITEKNTLFESLTDKVNMYPDLRDLLYSLLMTGRDISYNPDSPSIDIAMMFGFVKVEKTRVVVANRIFETRLYNMFLTSPEMQQTKMYTQGVLDKCRFIKDDELDMKLVLERFVVSFNDLYGDRSETFLEEDGRRYFLLYLRPIINGSGNYYVESRTRNMERTDVVVDYSGKQYVIEMKIWRGDAYNTRGEQQLTNYLDYYHLDKGYMLSFDFNKKKEIGVKEIRLGEKTLIEAVV